MPRDDGKRAHRGDDHDCDHDPGGADMSVPPGPVRGARRFGGDGPMDCLGRCRSASGLVIGAERDNCVVGPIHFVAGAATVNVVFKRAAAPGAAVARGRGRKDVIASSPPGTRVRRMRPRRTILDCRGSPLPHNAGSSAVTTRTTTLAAYRHLREDNDRVPRATRRRRMCRSRGRLCRRPD